MESGIKNGSVQQNLKNRHLLTLADHTQEELIYLLDLAAEMKHRHKTGIVEQPLKGKTLGMLFEKSSTRTRVSFETGIFQLGGTGIFLNANDIQIGRGEPVADTAKVLSGYLDGIMIRTYSQKVAEELAQNASVPVINGLTDLYHPCQVLADLLTIREQKGNLKDLKLAYIGDGNNMTHSLMIGAAMTGMKISVATPYDYQPDQAVSQKAAALANHYEGSVELVSSPQVAVDSADVIYTDVWASMGHEAEQLTRQKAFIDYQVNRTLCSHAKKDAIFMHCLPAHRGEEVTSDVIDGSQSVVFEQAENRLHAQKALMTDLMS